MPPVPNPLAALPLIVEWVMVNVAPTSLRIPAPSPTVVLSRTADRSIVATPPRALCSPPPLVAARLATRRVRLSMSTPAFSMPPPTESERLSRTTTDPSVNVPWFKMPAPRSVPATWPPAAVRSSIVTRAPAAMSNTRVASPPLTVSRAGPGPRTVSSSVSSNSLVRVIVPAPAGRNRITSAPGWAAASRTACRSEPGPASPVFLTQNVLGTVRSSSDSIASGTARSLRSGVMAILSGIRAAPVCMAGARRAAEPGRACAARRLLIPNDDWPDTERAFAGGYFGGRGSFRAANLLSRSANSLVKSSRPCRLSNSSAVRSART